MEVQKLYMRAKVQKVERKGKYLIVTLDQHLSFRPGNTIDVTIEGEKRTFSIASRAGEPLTFATIAGQSKFKGELKEGREVEVDGPFEDEFVLKGVSDHVFVTKGIGITPVRPMLYEALARGDRATLFYETDYVIFDDLVRFSVNRMPTPKDLADHAEAFFYVSGTPSDTKEITRLLIEAGVKPGKLVVEPFSGYD